LETVNGCSLALDRHLITDAVYTDFQKAFDSVPHPKLISKLETYNITGYLLYWIAAFLSNTTQRVKIGNTSSELIAITTVG
jgi:Reverse transcriptase (RNA-dependent DNA polymerase)